VNIEARQMMDKWSRRAERNYKIAEKYRLLHKETGDGDYADIYGEFIRKGQICGQAAADFEELI